MLKAMLNTENDRLLALMRIVLGVVMFPHGAQKVLGWFGGYGIAGTYDFFTNGLHIWGWVAYCVIFGEFLASLGLLTGTLGRVAAAVVFIIQLGGVIIVHSANGFFMNWGGKQAGEGYEFHLMSLTLAIVIVIRGSGAFSLDRLLAKR